MPGFYKPPRMTYVTKTTMTLSWEAPVSDEGCPILSYHLYMDDGANGSFTEIEAANINNLPALRSHQITSFTVADTSKTFRFYMQADNIIGSTTTPIVSFVLAKVPDKPPTVPSLNFD